MNELVTIPPGEIIVRNYCRQCGTPLKAEDNFCGRCGTGCHDLAVPVEPASDKHVGHASSVVVTGGSAQAIQAILNNRLAVIGIIALIGPLGLPALWFSSRFSNTTKIVTTVLYVLLTTVVPIAIAWYLLDYSVRPLVDVLEK